MPDFIPGIELSRDFYHEAVRPILDRHFPGLPHAAAVLGPGSEVQGFDTPRSRDHNWGPRVDLYLRPEDRAAQGEAIMAALSAELPRRFRGYGTHFLEDPDEPGTIMAADPGDGPLKPYIFLLHAQTTARRQIGFDMEAPLSALDWLCIPQQRLRAMTGGEVFHDGLGDLSRIRKALAWYPDHVWRYLLATGWRLIGQEEPFMRRTAEAGDEIGSRVVAARLVRWCMQLALLQGRQYAPYSKWLGTAFSRMEAAGQALEKGESSGLERDLVTALASDDVMERERALCGAYEELAKRQNALGLSEPVPEQVSDFHSRPFQVIHGEATGAIIEQAIEDPLLRALPKGVGGVDQWVDNTDVLSHPKRFRASVGVLEA